MPKAPNSVKFGQEISLSTSLPLLFIGKHALFLQSIVLINRKFSYGFGPYKILFYDFSCYKIVKFFVRY